MKADTIQISQGIKQLSFDHFCRFTYFQKNYFSVIDLNEFHTSQPFHHLDEEMVIVEITRFP